MLVGIPPFESPSVKSTLKKVRHGEYDLPHHLSREAKDLIKRLLVTDPEKRPSIHKLLKHPFFRENLNTREGKTIGSTLTRVNLHEAPSIKMELPRVVCSLQPLNTQRLLPTDQKTRHGHLRIQNDGSVYVKLNSHEHEIVVSGNGKNVRFLTFN